MTATLLSDRPPHGQLLIHRAQPHVASPLDERRACLGHEEGKARRMLLQVITA